MQMPYRNIATITRY